MRISSLLSALLALALLPGCGIVKGVAARSSEKRRQKAMAKMTDASKKEASDRLGERAVGEIVRVDLEEKFVLVRLLDGASVNAGAPLETRRGSERTAKLVLSPESKRPFAAADISSGEPTVGDSVIVTGKAPEQSPATRGRLIGERTEPGTGSDTEALYNMLKTGANPSGTRGEKVDLPAMAGEPERITAPPELPDLPLDLAPGLPPMEDAPGLEPVPVPTGTGPRILTVEDVLGPDSKPAGPQDDPAGQ